MKTFLLTIVCAASMLCFAGGKNVLKNGGFEEDVVIAKALDKNLLEHIRAGWTFLPGPAVTLPKHWRPCGGAAYFELIDIDEEPEKKEFVHSGKRSCYFRFSKTFCYMLNTFHFEPGEYELKFWYRGKGRIAFADICYGMNPATGKPGKHLKSNRFYHANVNTAGDWKFFSGRFKLGAVPETLYFVLYFGGINGEVYLDDVELIKLK